MNGNSVLIDTNIVLYLLSGDQVLADLLYDRKIYISFITQLELLGYPDIAESDKKIIQEFINECMVIDINNFIKDEVIRIKQNHRIKLPDSIILATSKFLGFPLLTADKELAKIDEIDLIIYER